MIGIFLKELRENLKWAGLIFGVLMVFFLHEIRDAEAAFLFDFAGHYMILAAPLAGLLMGIVQTLFETRPDNWAFTVHRPVPRLQIFIAKSAAGLVLLYGSLMLVTAIASIWAARPGHIDVPYQFRMSLPMVSDDLISGCYYFVGMVLALRRARWLGSRMLPLGMVLLASALNTGFIAQFWQTAVMIVLVISIGAVAAWGAFSSHGECDTLSSRLALGTLIWPGAFALGMFIFMISDAFQSGGVWHYYQVSKDGQPVVVTQRIERDQRSFTITDISGNPLPEYKNVDLDDPAYASLFVRFPGTVGDSSMLKWPLNVMYGADWYRRMDIGVVPLRSIGPRGVRLRFAAMYNVPRRVIQLYDPITCTQIGSVTPDGFTSGNDAPRGEFPEHILNIAAQGGSHVMAFGSVVYRIELDQRRVRPIFTAPPDDPVIGASEFGPDTNPLIVVATARQMHVFETSSEKVFSAPLPMDARTHYASAGVLPSNRHLVLDTNRLPGLGGWDRKIQEYSISGELLRTTVLPELPEFRGPKLSETAAFGAMFPIGLRPIVSTWILDEVLDIRSEAFAGVFDGFMIGAAIISGIATLWLTRRMGMGTTASIGWTIANILLGAAGALTMLSVNEWPARETCAACGAQRIYSQRDCPKCKAPLAPADSDGREIFEPADALLPAM
jgi:hypothetical protein